MLEAQVISVEKIRDGVVVEFNNGKCAIYSATLLMEIYKDAVPVEDPDANDAVEQ